jgi:DNA-binding MarR family transcriptional regulator
MAERAAPSDDVVARGRRQGLVTEKLPQTIDRDHYTPALLALLSNIMVWGGSRVFHHLRGIGTNEWQIISALGNYPGSTASNLCEILGMNKSIASTSVKALLNRDLIAQLNGPRGSRHLYLTPDGARVHDELLPVALKREEILHESLSPEEVDQLNALLVRMLSSSESMQRHENEILASPPNAADRS